MDFQLVGRSHTRTVLSSDTDTRREWSVLNRMEKITPCSTMENAEVHKPPPSVGNAMNGADIWMTANLSLSLYIYLMSAQRQSNFNSLSPGPGA